jgi:NAD(P)-dependent dehydrogenase (short-subunit alcohol dehydrogenase family)
MNKIVCISGVSRGLGYAMAKEFDHRGWQVAGCSRSEDLLKDLSKTLLNSHCLVQTDVTQPQEVDDFSNQVLSALGTPKLLVNNAGLINRNAKLQDVSPKEFEQIMAVNLGGTHNMIRSFLPKMEQVGEGIIANFSSYWGQSTAPEVAPYCASKWGVEGLTKALAQELPHGLATVAFNPGVIDTEMLRSTFGDAAGTYEKPSEWAQHAVNKLEELTTSDNSQTIVG